MFNIDASMIIAWKYPNGSIDVVFSTEDEKDIKELGTIGGAIFDMERPTRHSIILFNEASLRRNAELEVRDGKYVVKVSPRVLEPFLGSPKTRGAELDAIRTLSLYKEFHTYGQVNTLLEHYRKLVTSSKS